MRETGRGELTFLLTEIVSSGWTLKEPSGWVAAALVVSVCPVHQESAPEPLLVLAVGPFHRDSGTNALNVLLMWLLNSLRMGNKDNLCPVSVSCHDPEAEVQAAFSPFQTVTIVT